MKKRLMISTVFVIGFLGLMGCHKKEQEVSIVETSKEAEEVVESTENYNVDDSILVMDLPDNDTGIKNP